MLLSKISYLYVFSNFVFAFKFTFVIGKKENNYVIARDLTETCDQVSQIRKDKKLRECQIFRLTMPLHECTIFENRGKSCCTKSP